MRATSRLEDLQDKIKVEANDIKDLRIDIVDISDAADWFLTQTQREFLFDAESEVNRAEAAICKLGEAIHKLYASLGNRKK